MMTIQHTAEHPEGVYIEVPDEPTEEVEDIVSPPSIEQRLEAVEDGLADIAEVISND